MATLAVNAVAPGLLDRYLGKTGIDSQQTSEPHDPDAPDNLFSPADSPRGHDFGAHGEFDSTSRTWDPQLWASRNHGTLAAGAAAALAGLIGWRRSRA
jgi:hypothetical protein